MKPIEPGCLAMIIGLIVYTEDNYKTVYVVEKWSDEDGDEGWICEGDIISQDGIFGVSSYDAKNLLRIDNPFGENSPYQVKDKEFTYE